MFAGLNLVEKLFICYSSVHNIEIGSFNQMGATLKRFRLNNNFIEQLDDNFFQGLVNLIYLDLSFNPLSSNTPLTFAGLDKLECLDWSGNPISKYMTNLLPPSLKRVYGL